MGCGGGLGPAVVFLADGGVAGVVSHEGVEGAESGPTRAECLGGIAGITTDVGSNHWDLEDAGEVEHAGDAGAILLPCADIVTKPLANILAQTNKGGTGDEEWAACRATLDH